MNVYRKWADIALTDAVLKQTLYKRRKYSQLQQFQKESARIIRLDERYCTQEKYSSRRLIQELAVERDVVKGKMYLLELDDWLGFRHLENFYRELDGRK